MPAVNIWRWLHGLLWALALAEEEKVNVELDHGVYVLTQKNFQKALQNPKYPVMMVKFYTPGCQRCKEMAPKYAKAAKALRKQGDSGPRLAQVDAEVEKERAAAHEVPNDMLHPILIVFKDGKVLERYMGPQIKSDIVDYLNSLLLPEPIGFPLRKWYLARAVLKDIILPIVPSPLRRLTRKALPAIVLSPLLAVMLFIHCCCSGGGAPPPPKQSDSKAGAGESASSEGEKKPKGDSKPEAGKAKARASSPASRQ